MPPKGYKLSEKAKENIRQGAAKLRIEAKIDRNELYSLYWDEQLSAREIADLKGVTDSCVFNWLWRLKIPRRSPSEFTKLAYHKLAYPLVGEKSPYWKGGTSKDSSGYISIHIYPDHPFWCMAREQKGPGGFVYEHRLVMAQHLGRPLEPWEIVHHKGTKYPQGSIEDKGDNRIENLELHPKQASHVSITMLKRELAKRDKDIRLLTWQVKMLTERLNQAGISHPLEQYED